MVESETHNETWYFVRYEPNDYEWCSCKDFENRSTKCNHLYAVHFAVKLGIFKDKKTRKEFAEKFRKTKQLEYSQEPEEPEEPEPPSQEPEDSEEPEEPEPPSQEPEDSEEDIIQVPPKQMSITITDSRDKIHSWTDDNYDF